MSDIFAIAANLGVGAFGMYLMYNLMKVHSAKLTNSIERLAINCEKRCQPRRLTK